MTPTIEVFTAELQKKIPFHIRLLITITAFIIVGWYKTKYDLKHGKREHITTGR